MEPIINMTKEQRQYLFPFIAKRLEKLTTRLNAYSEVKKRDGDLNPRKKYQEKKDLEEVALIHSIMHELYACEFNVDL